jgi:hypothetical protein
MLNESFVQPPQFWFHQPQPTLPPQQSFLPEQSFPPPEQSFLPPDFGPSHDWMSYDQYNNPLFVGDPVDNPQRYAWLSLDHSLGY